MEQLGCDVLVVGGGIGGVSVAALVAAGKRVVLVEAADQLATQSTGRSAAVYLPSYGNAVVRDLTVRSRPGYEQMAERVGHPLLVPRPELWLALDEPGAAELARIGAEIAGLWPIDAAEAVRRCPILDPAAVRGGLLDDTAADIDVAGLHGGYVRLLRERGGTILRSAPLLSARRTGSGWLARCGDRQITCDLLVDAAGAWADEVAERCGVAPLGLTPCRRTAAIVPLPAQAPGPDDWPLVTDAADRFYFRPDSGRTLLVSPADETPTEAGDPKPDELALARAMDDLNAALTVRLRSIRHAWAGLRTFPADRTPVAAPAADEPSFVFLAGQGGYGIQTAPALAAQAARACDVDAPA